jgi:hypothetical protein
MLRSVLLSLVALAFSPFCHAAEAQSPPLAGHVVLISVDGLRPDFYLDDRWPAPTLQQMAREGVHARAVRGVFPSVTYPSRLCQLEAARTRYGRSRSGCVNLGSPGSVTSREMNRSDRLRCALSTPESGSDDHRFYPSLRLLPRLPLSR